MSNFANARRIFDENFYPEIILEEAKILWEECPSDYCIQYINDSNGVIVFGSTNRVVWTPRRGFRLEQSHCSERFIEHYKELMGEE